MLSATDSTQLCCPAEWQQQDTILLAWPHDHTDWATMLDQVDQVYLDLVVAICRHQQVWILCRDHHHETHIRTLLATKHTNQNRLSFYHIQYNDTWIRDYGPISIYKGMQTYRLDFDFNGWGHKFDATLDNSVNQQLGLAGAWPAEAMLTFDYVLEGGSIDSDGQGTLLTTANCLLNPNRNPGYSRQQVEAQLGEMLGSQRVLWLEHGYLRGDDTDSHIDMLARFCSADTIAYSACDNQDDEHYAVLKQMETELKQFRTKSGAPYKLAPLPIPAPMFDKQQQRLPASYANFLIINNAVLLPVYRDQHADAFAVAQLEAVFSDRDIVTIDCKPLIMQHGSLHCACMQLAHQYTQA